MMPRHESECPLFGGFCFHAEAVGSDLNTKIKSDLGSSRVSFPGTVIYPLYQRLRTCSYFHMVLSLVNIVAFSSLAVATII